MSSFKDRQNHGMLLVEAVEALKSSWLAGGSSIESIGSKLTGATRVEALLQLVLVDSELAIAAEQECSSQRYVQIFPDLKKHQSVIDSHIATIRSKKRSDARASEQDLFSHASLEQTVEHTPRLNQSDAARHDADAGGKNSADDPDFISSYRILRELGHGSFGKVLLAEDTRLQRNVAIKIQDAKNQDVGLSDAFLHEARAISRLDHANIVRLLHVDETIEGLGYLVYEYVAGATLADRVKQADYSVEQAVGWISDVAQALDYAHRRGVIHRDISPRNIMIDGSGKARLLDFGLSSLDDRFHTSDENCLLGTPSFMSPEQASGKPHWATSLADLFSLGSVLYYLLTAKLPFQGTSVFDVCERVQSYTPPPVRSICSGVPMELEAVVNKAMAKEPQSRYSTGADFSQALKRSISSRTKSNNRAVMEYSLHFAVIAIALTLIGIGAMVIFPKTPPPPPGFGEPIPRPELRDVKLICHRLPDEKKDVMKKESKDLLPLRSSDYLQLQWAWNREQIEAPYTYVQVIGSEDQRKPLEFANETFGLKTSRLFKGTSLILLCLSNKQLDEKSFEKLPSPWLTNYIQPFDSIESFTYNAEQVRDKFNENPRITMSRSSTNETNRLNFESDPISKDFEEAVKDLGVQSFVLLIINRTEDTSD